MPETAQQPMECTTTFVTTLSTPPTKGIWGKHMHIVQSAQLFSQAFFFFIVFSLIWYCSPCIPSTALVPLFMCCPHYATLSLTTLTWPTVPSVSILSTLYVTLSAACLSICQHLSTNHCPVGKVPDLTNKQSFVRPAKPHSLSAKS